MRRLAALVVAGLLLAASARAENATTPGKVTAPYPTVTNLAVEWSITGDDNLNGVVQVRYRKVGAEAWKAAMPLRRVPAGQSRGTRPIFKWTNRHSGSIFDLQPNAEYEIQLKLKDPDGGEAEETIRARTRPVPRATGQVKELSPGNHGTLSPASGSPGRWNVYRSSDGGAVYQQVNLRNKKWVIVEGVTVRNPDTSRRSKGVVMGGAEYCAVIRCNVKAVYGILAYKPGCTNCYIADNVVEGTTKWTSEAMGASGRNIGEGIQITGSGNVVCYNKVTGFRDAISTMEDTGVATQDCIDIYNNDVYVGADDGIEADFCQSNCRIMRNRITNSFVGLSSQPGLGGPTYFIRNVMYNLTYAPYKFHRYSQGDVVLHNTVVKVGAGMGCYAGQPFDHAYFRNNLAIGGASGQRWGNYGAGNPSGATINSHGPHCSFDYDAVGTHKVPFRARIGGKSFSATEPHGIKVDMGVFNGVEFPDKPVPGYEPPDLRPRAGAKVVDAALAIPNINDGYLGRAPDIGAYEAGQKLPHYGPRKPGVNEETEYLRMLAGKNDESPSGGSRDLTRPSRPAGPAEKAVAAARAAVKKVAEDVTEELRKKIIAGVEGGQRARVYVDIAGAPTRGRLVGAGEKQITVRTSAGQMELPWRSVSRRRFAGIASKYAGEGPAERLQVAALYAASDEIEAAAKIVTALGEVDEKLRPLAEQIRLLEKAAK